MYFNIWITGTLLTFMYLQTDENMRESGSINGFMSAIWPFTWILMTYLLIDEIMQRRKRWKEASDVRSDDDPVH